MVDDFCKYLTQSNEDLNWGVALTMAGFAQVAPGAAYPPMQHPAGHQFTIQQRRILSEYQVIYITKGSGYFESEQLNRCEVHAGSVLLLFPGVWHRYHPDSNTGWTEYYLGFKGSYIDQLVKHKFFSKDLPVMKVGKNKVIKHLFQEVFDLVKQEKSGYQQNASGILVNLLGKIVYFSKNNAFDGEMVALVEKSKSLLNTQASGEVDWNELSNTLGISYSKFRKIFKSYVGMPPGQYLLQLKVSKARELLLQTNMPLNKIADSLGFRDQYYFNSLFRQKTGLSPGLYRKTYTLA